MPPKCLFASPRPNNLITVPSCTECNRRFGQDDERVRNLLSVLAATASHPVVEKDVIPKMERSLARRQGRSNLNHILDSLLDVDVWSTGGVYLGRADAIELDQPVMDRFVDRLVRGLLYYENGLAQVRGSTKWRLPPTGLDLQQMPRPFRELWVAPRKFIGDVFGYFGLYQPERSRSLWIMQFYGAVELMAIFRPRTDHESA